MTLWVVMQWSVVRSVIIATVALALGRLVLRQPAELRSALRRRVLLCASLAPLIVPDLIIGFTYRLTAQYFTHSPWGTELLYGLLLLARATAACVLVEFLMPVSEVSREALHSWSLLRRHCGPRWWGTQTRLFLMGPWRGGVTAWCLAALIAFQDFETAALVQIDRHPITWTVWLFDANAGNQQLSRTLRLATAPVIFELLLIVPAIVLLSGGGATVDFLRKRVQCSVHWTRTVVVPVIPLAGVILTVLWPMVLAAREVLQGWDILLRDPGRLFRQQTAGLGFSVAATVVAVSTAILLRRSRRTLTAVMCLLPGLSGSLVLSLVLLGLFQLPGVRLLWDTWLPLLIGQALWILPRAFLLVFLLESGLSPETQHSTRLLLRGSGQQRATGRRLLWRLEQLRWLLVVTVLVHWCSWDVTTASILRPASVEPVVTRLYREMHFSRTESLTVLTGVTIVVPLFVAVMGAVFWRLLGLLPGPPWRR